MIKRRLATRRISADMLPSAEADTKGRLADFAFDYVRDLLIDNVLVSGDAISAEEVATRLGMSRYPVMEALKRLEGEGFLQIVPQVGCIVVDADPQEILDFYAIFATIEGKIAEMAAQRRKPQDLLGFNAIAAKLEHYLEVRHTPEESARVYRKLNRDFHSYIHRMASSSVVAPMSIGHWDRSDFYIGTVRGSSIFAGRIEAAHAEHEAVRSAIERGDAPVARRAMEDHLLETGRIVAERRRMAG
ncbi:MAG: GntR family transcriptional regulator [Alphaproteobacteria bacterium]